MRVIAGTARRLPLVAPEGKDTRPTTDRIKETLFNIIQDDIPGSLFLDLFSGSGAKQAWLVEFGREPLKCIRANLAKTRLEAQAVVLPIEVTYAISKLEKEGRQFDVVYADPPYKKKFEAKIVQMLARSGIVKEGTLVILESALDTAVDYVDEDVFELVRVKQYKTNQHVFLRVRETQRSSF